MIQVACLQDAIDVAAKFGLSEKLPELKQALLDASNRTARELKQIEVTQEIPVGEIIDEMMEMVQKAKRISPTAHLIFLALDRAMWPSWDEIKISTVELKRENPLQAMAKATFIGPDGHPTPAPDEEEERILFDEIKEFTKRLLFVVSIFSIKRLHLKKTGDWSLKLLLDALSGGVLFGGDAMVRLEPGVRAFEEERYWEAVHILVPQVERAIRQLGIELGVDVGAFKKETRKVQWTSLGEILNKEEVARQLSKLGPAYPSQLSYVLEHPYGMNLRNEVAHGILRPGASANTTASGTRRVNGEACWCA